VIAGGLWRQERDQQRRSLRLAKAAAALGKMAAVKRRKVDVQKLASQAGRLLERLKAHKYFTYRVDYVLNGIYISLKDVESPQVFHLSGG
jgi:hypothetical protein